MLQSIEPIMQGDRFLTFLFVDLSKACCCTDPVDWCFTCVDFNTVFDKFRTFILFSLVGIGIEIDRDMFAKLQNI